MSTSCAMAASGHTEARFDSTHWSIVLAAGRPTTPQAADALEKLCRIYWPPAYAFIRRQGRSSHDAQDLTQEFFGLLVEKNYLGDVDREKGRFRSFLLASLRHFLSNEWDRAKAVKRGGRASFVSLEEELAEKGYLDVSIADPSPEKAFDQRWALTVLDRAFRRLREEHAASGKLELFEQLKGFLSNDSKDGYGGVAAMLGLKPGTVAVTVHRLRQRYRELVRAEVALTVASPLDVDAEMGHLFAALG